MKPGPIPAARRKLNPTFRDAVRRAMANGHPAWVLALVSEFPQASQFSELLHARRIRATHTNTKRLARVAAAIEFGGPLFLDEPEG